MNRTIFGWIILGAIYFALAPYANGEIHPSGYVFFISAHLCWVIASIIWGVEELRKKK